MKENLNTISKRLGISVSTVSRVLNGTAQKYRISQKTIDIVKAESRRCGYTPNHIAQSLRKEKSNAIGILIPSLDNLFFSKLSSILLSEIRKRGYFAIIMDSNENEHHFYESLAELVSYNVDGIIAVPCGNDPTYIENLRSMGHHIVLVDRYYSDSSIPVVSANNYAGAFEATAHLIKHGHKKICCIQGDPDSLPNKERVKGYTSAMKEAGLEKYIQVTGSEFSMENGYLETKILLLQEELPTAVFGLSNNITLGVIKAIREAGLRIGEDISLISFDSFTHMAFSEPPITRIAQPIEEMGMLAAKFLFSEIDGENKEEASLMLRPTMIEGKSVKTII